uniref:Uncharacterized protein n=1 Tax=Podoviridae sp. ctnCN2 TaxID=2825274 RepID=A0A8S5PK27_9CAUD|nr:MAG TPA: hypothetical protein [Podoviridae sp. ctnCN2]
MHPDEASARLIPQCIRFFEQRIVAAAQIVSVLALAVAKVWQTGLSCIAFAFLLWRIIAGLRWLVNRQS